MADPKVQPVQEPAQLEPEGKQEVAEDQGLDAGVLLAELDKLGVTDPEKLQGMATASREAGNLAAMMGTLRQENAQLRDLIQQGQKPAPRTVDPYADNEAVDLEQVVRRAVSAEYDAKEQARLQAMQQVQQQQQAEVNEIVSDEDYPLVEAKWNEYARSPQVTQKVQMGQTTYGREYHRLVKAYYRNLAKQSRGFVEKYVKGEGPKAPHLESGRTQAPPVVADPSTKEEALAKATKNWEGKDADLDNVIKAILPDGDELMNL